MDLGKYFKKIDDEKKRLGFGWTMVVSVQQGEKGGKDGVVNEVPNALAAKMLVDGCVREATEEEIRRYRTEEVRERDRLAKLSPHNALGMTIVSEERIRALENAIAPKEGN